MAPMIKMQIKNSTNEKALKTMVESLTNYLPGKKVAVGDKWSINTNTNSGGMPFDIVTNFALTAISGNSANVTAESNIKIGLNAEPMEMMGAKITYGDFSGISKSEMKIDTKTGLIQENTSKNHISGTLNVNAPGYNGEIPMVIDGETKVVALQ